MTVSIDDLTTPVTADEAKTSIYTGLASVGTNTTSWKPGSIVRALIAIIAVMYSAATHLIAEVAKSAFLESAFGAWLTLVARYRYYLERESPTFGSGTVRLENTSGNFYDLDPGDLIVRNPTIGKTYTNVAAISVKGGSDGTPQRLDVQVISQEAGSASTSAIGTVTELVTAFPGVSVTNTTAIVGLDEEEDDVLKQRCRDSLGSRSANGPIDALAFVARNAKRPDGSRMNINRLRTQKDGRGNLYLHLATPSGGLSADDLTLINAKLDQVTPSPFATIARSARALPIDVSYRLWLERDPGMSQADLEARIARALGKELAGVPLGGFETFGPDSPTMYAVYLDGIRHAISGVSNAIYHVEIVTPAAHVGTAYADAATLGRATCLGMKVQPQVIVEPVAA